MWPFRRRRSIGHPSSWFQFDRQAAYEFAAEIATWREPIDVIRDAFGLPPRFPTCIGCGWHAVLQAIQAQQPYQQFVTGYWQPSEHPTREFAVVPPGRATFGGGPLGRPGRRGAPPIGRYR